MTKVKICCIASEQEARLALDHGADALGFVAAMPSGPGVISDAEIALVISALPKLTNTFLLTSRTAPDNVLAHVHECRPATVQLVDAVQPETYLALRRNAPDVTIVQVIHVQGPAAIDEAVAAASHVDAILLDSGRTEGAVKKLGGTGRTHDWTISRAIVETVDTPVWLAGGLTSSNVAEAIAAVQPFGLDLCTGVRTTKKLDPVKLSAFMLAVRGQREHS